MAHPTQPEVPIEEDDEYLRNGKCSSGNSAQVSQAASPVNGKQLSNVNGEEQHLSNGTRPNSIAPQIVHPPELVQEDGEHQRNGDQFNCSKPERAGHWYYPPDLANDLKPVDLPGKVKDEIFACAWEYSRCVIPQYTNWIRYVAFMRIIVMGIVAEFAGPMVDVTAGDDILGYDLGSVLATLFKGTPG